MTFCVHFVSQTTWWHRFNAKADIGHKSYNKLPPNEQRHYSLIQEWRDLFPATEAEGAVDGMGEGMGVGKGEGMGEGKGEGMGEGEGEGEGGGEGGQRSASSSTRASARAATAG